MRATGWLLAGCWAEKQNLCFLDHNVAELRLVFNPRMNNKQ
jgi:hypothetical protein